MKIMLIDPLRHNSVSVSMFCLKTRIKINKENISRVQKSWFVFFVFRTYHKTN